VAGFKKKPKGEAVYLSDKVTEVLDDVTT